MDEKRLQLYINDPDEHSKEGIRGSINFQCPWTKQCNNDRCFWKQRSTHGRCPWTLFDDPEQEQKHKDIEQAYGKPYFPEWKVQVGTNVLTAYCPDFKD